LARYRNQSSPTDSADEAKKELDLVYLIENDVPSSIEGDVTRLRQVLVNLVNNGVKFTEQGDVFVHVSRKSGASDDLELDFSVRDTGIGISAEKQTELFQPFYQADSSTARKYGGTGLGLAISLRLVAMMGGTMTVRSAHGEGSQFGFTLRTRQAPAVAVEFSQSDQFAIQRKHLLLVDDNETALNILSTVVQRWGLTCETESSPQGALDSLRAGRRFDAAIFDYHMPGMDGVQLARETRSMANCSGLPLILFSSSDTTVDSEGADDLFAARITKPLRQTLLFDALVETLGGRKRAVDSNFEKVTSQAQRTRRSQVRLLVGEDNSINLRLVTLMLNKLGYVADVAGNGIEVLQALKRQSYDVILMDVQMPEMDGVEATRQIRRSEKHQPYIIALTANVLPDDRKLYTAAGMNAFLAKPLTTDELESALAEAMENIGIERNDRTATMAEPAIAASSALILLDERRVHEILDLTRDAGDNVFGEMIEHLHVDIAELNSQLDSGDDIDPAAFMRSAHSLKGASRSLGAQALGHLYEDLERLGKAADFVEFKRRVRESDALVERSLDALRKYASKSL
jgi:CheY-like chemotaxis protein/HPt (histidine-containing phosphotransfer) domain-containing protein